MSLAHPGDMTSLSRRAIAWISAAGLVVLFELVPSIGAADRSAFSGRLDSGTALMVVERLALATISVVTLAVGLVVLTGYTARRRGIGPAVRIAVSVVGAAVSAELLKRVLPFDPTPTPTGQAISSGSFPSGHSAIAAAFALAVAATVGPRLARLWWGPLVAWVSLVAAGTVAAGWHRPSDAVGGVLLAVIWHTVLVRRPASEASSSLAGREPGGLPSARGIPGSRWWALMGAAILAGALAPRAGAGTELGEAARRLYVLGLGAVLAATGALMLVGPQRVPALRGGRPPS
jgi:membrane-associated phospholipid phosphatase